MGPDLEKAVVRGQCLPRSSHILCISTEQTFCVSRSTPFPSSDAPPCFPSPSIAPPLPILRCCRSCFPAWAAAHRPPSPAVQCWLPSLGALQWAGPAVLVSGRLGNLSPHCPLTWRPWHNSSAPRGFLQKCCSHGGVLPGERHGTGVTVQQPSTRKRVGHKGSA